MNCQINLKSHLAKITEAVGLPYLVLRRSLKL